VNTFLPYPPDHDPESGFLSFRNSARVLDGKRLNKQTLEASQILDILCGNGVYYSHHPAVLQWKGHEWVLLDYLSDMCKECLDGRNYKNSIFNKIYDYHQMMPDGASTDMPPWMGDKAFHASHRSRLLFKGRCDVAIAALKEYHKFKNLSQVKFWLISDFCPMVISDDFVRTSVLSHNDIEQIEKWLESRPVEIAPNYYYQFKWAEPDTLPYVWPVTIAKLREQKVKA
jgi:hypothetical protein